MHVTVPVNNKKYIPYIGANKSMYLGSNKITEIESGIKKKFLSME